MAAVAAAATYKGAQYGAVELKKVYQKYWMIGLRDRHGDPFRPRRLVLSGRPLE